MKIISDIKHINKYILNPYHDVANNFSTKEKWRILFSSVLYKLVFAIFIGLPIIKLVEQVSPPLEFSEVFEKESLLGTFLLIVIVVPFIEEILFRLPLNFYRNPLIIFDDSKSKIEIFWKKYFKYIFYIFSIGFALVHITNYKNQETIFYLFAPLLVISQWFGGIIYGYIRMHLGFLWGFLCHAFFNFIVAIIPIILFHNTSVFEKKNDTIDLTINELNYYEKNDRLSLKLIDNKVISISMNDETIQVLLDTLYNKQYKTVDNHLAKVELTTKEPISKEELLEILKEEYRIEKK